jgi:hypothetical protein
MALRDNLICFGKSSRVTKKISTKYGKVAAGYNILNFGAKLRQPQYQISKEPCIMLDVCS